MFLFNKGSPVLTTVEYPADIDTTSIACTAMGDRFSEDMKKDIMDDILALRNEDGITLMYYDPSRPRIGRHCTSLPCSSNTQFTVSSQTTSRA